MILSVMDTDDNMVADPGLVQHAFVSHFQELLTPCTLSSRPSLLDIQEVIRCLLTEDQVSFLSHPFTDEEIHNTMFSLAWGKAPRPDGYGVEFFKHNWELVGPLVTEAIRDFLVMGKLLREINNTILVLIPKVPNATSVN